MPSCAGMSARSWERSEVVAMETVTDASGGSAATDARAGVAAIRLSGISAGYGGRVALDDVTLAISTGSMTAVVGPNGGGKSTLLKVMAGLLQPWAGTTEVLGAPVGERARDVAYVPQAESVDWAFPVAATDVVMMGRYARLGVLRRPGRDDQQQVDRALEAVGMADLRN